MTTVLVTGSDGFIGRNLVQELDRDATVSTLRFDINDDRKTLLSHLDAADAVVHLAGVNRPEHLEEFISGNVGLTEQIVSYLLAGNRRPILAISSSIQAELDNPYGRSKAQAERLIDQYGKAGGPAVVFRLPNVFGKWSRPNYNSAVATFCHNLSRGLDVNLSDPNRIVELAYIDDVVRAIGLWIKEGSPKGTKYVSVSPTTKISLGDLVAELERMRDIRTRLVLPDMSDNFRRCLYATYLSFLPEDSFDYQLTSHVDSRGGLAELLKSPQFGQIFVSRTKPGVIRGNHSHKTKVEKFCVVEGDAIIRFRHILYDKILAYPVKGDEFRVVDIPPGYTHTIENVGKGDMVVLFWSSEMFDPSNPDTYANSVSAQ